MFKKAYIFITTLISIISISYIVYMTNEYNDIISQKNREFNRITNEVAELRLRFTKQVQITQKFKKDFKEIKLSESEEAKVITEAIFKVFEKGKKKRAPAYVINGKKVKGWIVEVGFDNGPPVGFVTLLDNGDIISRLYNHEIATEYSITKDEQGQLRVYSRTNYILRSKTADKNNNRWNGQKYPLKIADGQVQISDVSVVSRFKFNLSPSLSLNNNRFNVGASLFEYGEYNKPKYKFLTIGLDFDKNISKNSLTITPIHVKIFDGVLSDTYFGIGTRLDGKFFFSLNTTL